MLQAELINYSSIEDKYTYYPELKQISEEKDPLPDYLQIPFNNWVDTIQQRLLYEKSHKPDYIELDTESGLGFPIFNDDAYVRLRELEMICFCTLSEEGYSVKVLKHEQVKPYLYL